jgi:GT2 family glycosyltransferase
MTSHTDLGAPDTTPSSDDFSIAIVVITHDRLHLLRKCVEQVIGRTSELTKEIVIWSNGSSDGTDEYLDALDDPRITVVHHGTNIGNNAYAEGFRLTSAAYLIDLDDDVVEAPAEWDRTMLDAYRRLPEIGFLAADLEEDEFDEASLIRHRHRPDAYQARETNGVRILEGPTGGGCAMTDRQLYNRVGGFRQRTDQVFFLEDAEYIVSIRELGYGKAVLADLRVHHTGGSYYSGHVPSAKIKFWDDYWRVVRRRNAVKRLLLRIPLARAVNDRLGIFGPPEMEFPPSEHTRETS